MSEIAIQVEHMGKQYRIGQKAPYLTFRDAITNTITAPIKRFKEGSRLTDQESKFWALKDVSFDVEKGEVLGIIGRNGAGKSTLLKILSRITDPTEGYAKIYGRVGSLLEVGTGFHPELTGRENIYLSGSILGMKKSEIDNKFDEIVKFAETEKFLDTALKHYSSGMQVRLGFAVAAYLDPEILIIDEVLAVGDAEFQKKCLGKIEDVSKAGRTVLFVSHNMEAIERLCSRVIQLDKGKIVQNSNSVNSVIHNYLYANYEERSFEWINSRNEFNSHWLVPRKFYLSNKNNIKQGIFTNNSEIWINIELEIKELDSALTIGYAIYDESGNLLYWSYHTDVTKNKWPDLKLGMITLRSMIPKRLLNEGIYKIELIGSLHFREWLLQPIINAPSIYLTIQGELSDSPLWMVKRPGILAPVIDWCIIDNDEMGQLDSNIM
ncbi:ABC transporter ATP binding protein [Methanocella paludicola SANAE]|uniref:ABC transporter ATP binding protein n=1 Tax=Methanocella paludicola (strain DSM 17711 / JCM 13418 / NBRC 101707 / SANAE) TaxID=304371 RepID=D1YZY5_METPS|nr:ABC transporter ATP-binding protein [Methanocella paludicola]BAI62007.1 ABC transporter ATP binding protein [Methanocella paludicola SANAE]